MDTNMLYRIQRAILDRQSLEEAGLSGDPEIKATYLQMKKEIEEAPQGTMLQIIDDPEWGKWDALIKASSKASGIDYMNLWVARKLNNIVDLHPNDVILATQFEPYEKTSLEWRAGQQDSNFLLWA